MQTHTMAETLLYALAGTKEKRSVTVLGPAWSMAYWARGYAYGEMARYDDEQADLEKALALAPNNAQYSNELAYVMMRKRAWDRSMALYQAGYANAGISSSSDDSAHQMQCTSLRGQGYVLVERQQLDEAEAKYRACLAIIPDEPKSLGEIDYIAQQRKKLPQTP